MGPWRQTTPFGSPVEPEVKAMYAGSSAVTIVAGSLSANARQVVENLRLRLWNVHPAAQLQTVQTTQQFVRQLAAAFELEPAFRLGDAQVIDVSRRRIGRVQDKKCRAGFEDSEQC